MLKSKRLKAPSSTNKVLKVLAPCLVPALWFLASFFYSQQATGVAIVFLLGHRKKLTLTSLRAAAREWRKETEIME